MSDPDLDTPKPRFDPTINLGHILTALMMGAALVTMWANMKVGQADHEARIRALEVGQIETRATLTKLAELEAGSARTQDKLTLTIEYLSKQIPISRVAP